MPERPTFADRLSRTIDEHITAVGAVTDMRGSTQSALNALAERITDLNAAVVMLLRQEKKARRPRS
jgi:hypothetical protein